MILDFAHDAEHHGHDDHGDHDHGHASDHKPALLEVDRDKLVELYEMILNAVKGQLLYLYESGCLNPITMAIADVAVPTALESAAGLLEDWKFLKTSGDPVLQTLYKDKGRQTEMCIAVMW